MKSLIISLLMALGFSAVKGNGIEFFSGSFESAKAEAQAQGKLIFVDAYAVWCGPCKMMANNVFPLSEVGEAFNPYFISLKIDMERGEGLTFRKDYPVTAFPTLFFMNAEGEILERVVGAKKADDLINLAKKHASKRAPGKNLAAAYEAGDRSPELVLEYIQALNTTGKSSLKVTNDFLKDRNDHNNPEVLKIIFHGSIDSDSKVFDLLLANRKEIEKIYSKEEVEEKILEACLQTVFKAAEFDYEELAKNAKETVKSTIPSESKRFNAQADMTFYAVVEDEKNFMNASKAYLKVFENDPIKIKEAAHLTLKHFPKSQKVLTEALGWAARAANGSEKAEDWLFHAILAEKTNQIELAKQSATKALLLAQKNEQSTFEIEKLLQNLELR